MVEISAKNKEINLKYLAFEDKKLNQENNTRDVPQKCFLNSVFQRVPSSKSVSFIWGYIMIKTFFFFFM